VLVPFRFAAHLSFPPFCVAPHSGAMVSSLVFGPCIFYRTSSFGSIPSPSYCCMW
jgi:hypothetical protein